MGVGLWLYYVHVTWHGVYFSSGMVKWEHAAAAAAVVSIRSLLVVLNEGSDLKPMLQHPLTSWTQGGLPSVQTHKYISTKIFTFTHSHLFVDSLHHQIHKDILMRSSWNCCIHLVLKSMPQTGRNTKTNEVMVILMKMFDTNTNRKSKLYPQQ